MRDKIYDVVVIGGGASGLCLALALKMQDRSIDIVILEQLDRVGKKLITTGNGRCNISNFNINMDRYHGQDKAFAEFALNTFDRVYTESFFADLGIVFTYDNEGRAYPYSLQASSVVDAMRLAADCMKVETKTSTKALDFKCAKDSYTVTTDSGEIKAKSVVFAAGLYSGGKKLGSDGSILRLLKNMGYKTVKTTPAIVQLKTENELTRSLKGIKVNARAALIADNKELRSETGEVLFCDYGLSGPPIMQLSRAVECDSETKYIELDLMPEYSFDKVLDLLSFRACALRGRSLENYFTGMLNKRVGQALIKCIGYKLSDNIDALNHNDFKRLAGLIKGIKFKVISTCGFEASQVTAGGLDTKQFEPGTMMSKTHENLYAIGEILDIDGDCGGFNLQWAWSSAFCCAENIINQRGIL